MRLPRDTGDLTGLRAARWVRESTAGQFDRFGPDAQREQQDRAIDRFGLVDTGLTWSVAHSGRTIAGTPEFAAMIAAAGEAYDVLLVGYVSRFARDLRTAVNARHDLHAAGASILFCDERVLSSDGDAWEAWAREAVEAEAYSRRLGKRIREGYAAKFRRHGDQGGNPPLGFRRVPPASILELDPETIGRAVAVFRRYSTGTVSLRELAGETGLRMGHLAEMLRNPIYNGWATRHGERSPAPWRSDPPVDDELWQRVEALRDRRRRAGGKRPGGRVDILRGLLVCPCGANVNAFGTDRRGRMRRAHPLDVRCAEWGGQATYLSETWEAPIAAQLAGLRLDDATLARAVAAATAGDDPAPLPIDAGRLDRRRRELALDHAAGRLTDDEYLTAAAALRAQREDVQEAQRGTLRPDEVVGYLTDLGRLWSAATTEERADLVAAVYDRIVVRGPEFVAATLTPSAYRHGLAVALQERVRVDLVSPEGVGPTRSTRIPIVGRAQWLAASRRTA